MNGASSSGRASLGPTGVLSGKVAIVTGGSRGLGAAIARCYAAHGADVAIVSRKLDACEDVARAIRGIGRRAEAYACDVSQWDRLESLVDAVHEDFGRLDVLVNNAGKSPLYDSLVDISESAFDSVLALNLKGPFRLGALVGERMSRSDGGSIINVSSIESEMPSPGALPYAAAKAGLNALTMGLARTYAPLVRVNAIVPGAFRTDVSRHWSPELWKTATDRPALGRVGEPEEICGAALFLASDASSYMTGALMRINGGIP